MARFSIWKCSHAKEKGMTQKKPTWILLVVGSIITLGSALPEYAHGFG